MSHPHPCPTRPATASKTARIATLTALLAIAFNTIQIDQRVDAKDQGEPSSAASEPRAATNSFSDRNASGQTLIDSLFELLSSAGTRSGIRRSNPAILETSQSILRQHLDDAFQSTRANGQRYVKSTYVPTDIDRYTISGLTTTHPSDDTIVARYRVATRQATTLDSNLVMSGEWAPRLTVFRWNASINQWQILSHANFNTPLAAICDSEDLSVAIAKPSSDASDLILAESLARKWFAALSVGKARDLMNSQAQGQTASGYGWANASQYIPGNIRDFQMSDVVATRNGNYLVVSASIRLNQAYQEGTTLLTETPKPRLLTYMKTANSGWQLIASATFAPPKKLPAGTSCVKPTI